MRLIDVEKIKNDIEYKVLIDGDVSAPIVKIVMESTGNLKNDCTLLDKIKQVDPVGSGRRVYGKYT